MLEIGCGPGLALAVCAAKLITGCAAGIDHSDVMIDQAGRRLAGAIERGRVELWNGPLEGVAFESASFDRVFSVNVVQFLPDLPEAFARMHGLLREGGICASTHQPRNQRGDPRRCLRNGAAHSGGDGASGFRRHRRRRTSPPPGAGGLRARAQAEPGERRRLGVAPRGTIGWR